MKDIRETLDIMCFRDFCSFNMNCYYSSVLLLLNNMSSPIMSKSAMTQRLKEVVVNVNMFCFKHFPHEGSSAIANLTAEATGYSRTTVYNVLKEYNTSEVLKENVEKDLCVSIFKPKTVLKRKSAVVDIDDFDQCAIRRIVHQFHIAQGALPTIKGILQKAREDLEFSGPLSSMRKIVQNLGFSWKKTETNRRILMERNDIRGLRIEFLRKITKFREEARPIVFMDETYIHAGHLSGKSWSDGSVNGVKCFISKGARAIIVHAGGEMGFIPNALLIFKSGIKSGDYHDDMNFKNYIKWVEDKLIPNLPPGSVLVIDNAPYHNVQSNPAPNSSNKKKEMLDWLTWKGIKCDDNLLKPELYNLVKANKDRFKTYKIDATLRASGHCVLRLPPYHPDLNPIELIWANVKNHVAKTNVTGRLDDAIALAKQKISLITKEDWQKTRWRTW